MTDWADHIDNGGVAGPSNALERERLEQAKRDAAALPVDRRKLLYATGADPEDGGVTEAEKEELDRVFGAELNDWLTEEDDDG